MPSPGAAVGQTVGTNITLDTNAAGNGWFIDTTPGSNEEYLPTSDPNVWKAKAGSAAAGKMDMLSVLLHEYGHALGIEHSANPYDYMDTTLQVGERRLPSADELALMQQLIQQAKAALSPTPLPQAGEGLTSTDYTGGNGNPLPLDLPLGGSLLGMAGFVAGRRTQYEVAANPSFVSTDTPNSWQTQGGVTFGSGTTTGAPGSTPLGQTPAVTLNETTTAQTRLSQIFTLGATDRYLSFTLGGAALDNPGGMPEDAFEVALLDANTGLSVLGSDGLTRTDAFLNLQGDGTQNAADCVTCTFNPDGSASPTRY